MVIQQCSQYSECTTCFLCVVHPEALQAWYSIAIARWSPYNNHELLFYCTCNFVLSCLFTISRLLSGVDPTPATYGNSKGFRAHNTISTGAVYTPSNLKKGYDILYSDCIPKASNNIRLQPKQSS